MISVPGDSSPTVTKMAAQIAAGTLSSAMARVCLTRSGGPTGDSAAFFAASAAWDRLRSDRGIVAIRARVKGGCARLNIGRSTAALPIDVPSLIPGIPRCKAWYELAVPHVYICIFEFRSCRTAFSART